MRIGIPVSNTGGGIGVREDLYRFVEEFGDPVLISGGEDVDALMLPGGADIWSYRYNESSSSWAMRPDTFLEKFDREYLPGYIGKVPIMGICRGLQTLNVHFGGSLHQHLKKHPYSQDDNDLVHEIFHHDGKFEVNSFHHQGIKVLAPNLINIGVSATDRVEAIQDEKLRIAAVQWHPERMYTPKDGYYDEWTIDLFKYFLGEK